MAWRKANQKSDLEKCLDIIMQSADHYSGWNLGKINNAINRKKGEMFFYESEDMKIALMFQWNYTHKIWRIKHGAYQGGDPVEAMKITWEKIRDFLDEKKTNEAYILISPVEEYKQSNQPYLNYLAGLKEVTIKENKTINRWDIKL